MYCGSTALNLKATMNTNQMNSHVTKNTKLIEFIYGTIIYFPLLIIRD